METAREDWLVREQFRIARVATLPYAHNPFKCAYTAEFKESGVDGRTFFESLTPQQLASCEFHRLADWCAVADASVGLFRTFRDRPMSELWAAIDGHSPPLADRYALHLLFADPIIWGGKATRVTNGQHRICAIRASGALRIVIDHNKLDLYPRD